MEKLENSLRQTRKIFSIDENQTRGHETMMRYFFVLQLIDNDKDDDDKKSVADRLNFLSSEENFEVKIF